MRCPACGSEAVVPSERRITVDRGEVFERPKPAVECPACGKMFAADEGGAGSSEDQGDDVEEDAARRDERSVVQWTELDERESRELVQAAKALLEHLGVSLSTLFRYAGISRQPRCWSSKVTTTCRARPLAEQPRFRRRLLDG